MDPQIITTETGDELVVLSRRAYDALLARLGDEDAEDRMTVRIGEEAERRLAAGEDFILPDWFAEAAKAGDGSILRGLRKHRGKSQEEVARAAGISQGYYSEVETGRAIPTLEALDRISHALDLDTRWMRALERDRVPGPDRRA